jgi:hypothetical protein
MLGVSAGELAGSAPHAVSATALGECARSRPIARRGLRQASSGAGRLDDLRAVELGVFRLARGHGATPSVFAHAGPLLKIPLVRWQASSPTPRW